MNNVVLIGRLVADPELRFIPGNTMAVVNFTLAIDKGFTREKKAELKKAGKPTADFLRVKVWGKQAENCSQYLTKGKLAAVKGSISTYSYTGTDKVVRYVTEIHANKVEYLEWGDKKESIPEDDFSFGTASFEDYTETDDDVPF